MIRFGTGGWRAIIADEFTKEHVQMIARAMAQRHPKHGVVIGYDRRFLSDVAARWFAEVLAAYDVPVYFINKIVPTPVVMFAVKDLQTDFGIAVTASHNPAIYNGIKIFTSGGRDARKEDTDIFERIIEEDLDIQSMDYEQALAKNIITEIDPLNKYIDSILAMLDTQAIRDAHLRVLVDPMHGVSKTSLSTILMTCRCDVDIINDRHDTLFGGKLPSPASTTLHKLRDMVLSGQYNMGIATDGDADRIGIIDEAGSFIHPNMLIALLYYYLVAYKHQEGAVVRNLSTSHLLDKIAADFNQPCIEVPVGFKYITEAMEQYHAIIGGESSGGLTIRGHIQGKDGILAASLLVEMVAVTGKSIRQLAKELEAKYGATAFLESSYRFAQTDKQMIAKQLENDHQLPTFPQPIAKIDHFDGLKIRFTDGSWVSARFSGTEPLIRIFAEAASQEQAEALIQPFTQQLPLTRA